MCRWDITGKCKMKKSIFGIVALSMGVMLLSSLTTNDMKNNCNSTSSPMVYESQSCTVFRGKQTFKNYKDNVEIYCYTDHKCEWYADDRLVLTCSYTVSGDEIKFLDEDGNTCYKGSISWNSSHSKPLSITINKTTYKNKDLV